MNYLYNEVELPALSLYNMTSWPYRAIGRDSKGDYWSIGWDKYKADEVCVSNGEIRHLNAYGVELKLQDGEWASNGIGTLIIAPFWANFDVLNEDGSVFLPASYPVDPITGEEITVYDPNIPVTKLYPSELMKGIFLVDNLKRNR